MSSTSSHFTSHGQSIQRPIKIHLVNKKLYANIQNIPLNKGLKLNMSH